LKNGERTRGIRSYTVLMNTSSLDKRNENRRRKQPHATVDDGFAHSVVAIMAARAQREGQKLYWDAANECIVDSPA